MAKYIDKIDLYNEIIVSKAMGKRTRELDNMLIKIAEGVGQKFNYNSADDRKDCQYHALLCLFEGWHHFDENRTSDPFSYLSQIAFNGFKRGFIDLYPIYAKKNEWMKDSTFAFISLSDIYTL